MIPARPPHVLTIVAGGLLLLAPYAAAQGSIQYMHTFTDSEGEPVRLMQASDGNFYGTTNGAVERAGGTVFKATRFGDVTVLHNFPHFGGVRPSDLIQATDGSLYGMSPGALLGHINATVFKIAADGTFSVVHEFISTSFFTWVRGLIQARDGNFYGVLEESEGSTAFRMTPVGEVSVLHAFGDSASSLIQARDGNFYGTTFRSGGFGAGTIFRMGSGGDVTVVHSFDAALGYPYPEAGLIEGLDGNLYGTTGGSSSRVLKNDGSAPDFLRR